jgi:PPOX class probable F420-dependent enzyme
MTGLADFRRIAAADRGLCVVATTRRDASVQASVVNAGVIAHPVDGNEVVAFVARGGARKLVHLRGRPQATIVARSGWEWAAVEGPAELIGPDDAVAGFDPETLRLLLRDVFTAAGGTHDDWETYDTVMAIERRTVVLVCPARVYANG